MNIRQRVANETERATMETSNEHKIEFFALLTWM